MKPRPEGAPQLTRRRFLRTSLMVGVSALAGSGAFSEDGFEKMVDKVSGIEKQLGMRYGNDSPLCAAAHNGDRTKPLRGSP